MKILHCNKTRNTYIAEAQERAAPKKLWIGGRKRNKSKYKPNISPPGALYLEIALKFKEKQTKNGKFPSN